MAVRFSVELIATAERREEIEVIFRSICGPTSVMEGCISCRISRDLVDPSILRLHEEWETEEHLKTRLRADDFRKVIAAMDLAGAQPLVRFELTSGERGIDYITAVRETLEIH